MFRILFFLFCSIHFIIADVFTPEELNKLKPDYDDSLHRVIKYKPFDVGEKFIFNIHYGMISAGKSIMEITGIKEVDNHLCYELRVINKTNSFFDKMYKVRDTILSYFDYDGIYSIRYEKHLREGKYRQDRIEIYDQDNHYVYSKKKWRKIKPFTLDALCAFYYIRTRTLIPGHDIFFENHTDGKNYSIRVKVLKKEIIKTKFGKVKTIKIMPLMKDPGVFKATGKITIWLTDDSLKIPVKMKSKVIVGSFSADLIEYYGTKLNIIKKN